MPTPHRRAGQGRPGTGRPGARRARLTTCLTAAGALLAGAACRDAVVPDYNDPTLGGAVADAAQLQGRASGLVAGDREQATFEVLVLETMGRDAYRIDVADPRYLLQPLGQFSPGAFLADFTWNVHYRTIRAAALLTSDADAGTLPAQDKAAVRGWARTWEALQYLRLIETRDTIGVPIISPADQAPAAVRCKPAVLAYTAALLDSAVRDLEAAGAAFPFTAPAGFSLSGRFDSPATFARFARGLRAKVQVYQGFADYARSGAVDAAALNAAVASLDSSFYDPAGALRDGVYHVYATSSGDLTNANFDQSVLRANPKVLADAEAGDARVAAKLRRDPALRRTNNDSTVVSDIIFTNVAGPTTPLPVLTNEELILLRAEALWGLGRDAEALAQVNVIRQRSGGLAPRDAGGFATRLDLLREILRQKRFSLLFESGDRLVDYRMFGLFTELGPELDQVTTGGPRVIPFPQAELDARGGSVSCTP